MKILNTVEKVILSIFQQCVEQFLKIREKIMIENVTRGKNGEIVKNFVVAVFALLLNFML